jgi:hypothetical protein
MALFNWVDKTNRLEEGLTNAKAAVTFARYRDNQGT